MGEIAALCTSFLWALSSISFSEAGKKVGSVIVNRIRLPYAVLFITLAHLFLTGNMYPLDAGLQRWFWLGLSGIVGLTLGDTFLFQAYVQIGPRLAMLVMASVPVISTIFAWFFLGETLNFGEIAGIFMTVAGISLVVLDRNGKGNGLQRDQRQYVVGLLFAFGGALGQAGGLVLAKQGLTGDFPVISGVWIRMFTAMIAIWLVALLFGQGVKTLRAISGSKNVWWIIGLGALVGPFLGVWLSLVSVRFAPVGIASTLMSLTPIFLLPIAKRMFKEEITLKAIIGTLLSMAGIAVIFIFP
jgi:drug/metabolite transporter (DMT)-like permease